jgi:hypothetical protein
MRIDWSSLLLLAAEFAFAVLFLRALFGYLRRRDPLQRDVTLVFLPCTVLFCVDVARRIQDGGIPAWVSAVTLTALMAQPYLTIRLAARLRSVPVWLQRTVLLMLAAVAGWLAFAQRPLHPAQLLAVVTAFLLAELIPS